MPDSAADSRNKGGLTMPAREKQKTKRTGGNRSSGANKSAGRKSAGRKKSGQALVEAVERLEAETRSLQDERDKLRAQLAAANARIAELEGLHTKAVDRIDWVIDSLHNVLEGNA